MPRAFTETEREAIRERLLLAARDLFGRRGIRATTVEQLARTAGISKGAFYQFYPSKEALFLALIEGVEAEIQARIRGQVTAAPADGVRLLLRASLAARDEHPLLDVATSDEAVAVLRTMSPVERQEFLSRDVRMTRAILADLAGQGVRVTIPPDVFAGLLRALVFVGLHRDDIGAELVPAVQELLVDSLTRTIVADSPKQGGRA
jgi:AcrR family transcriptional regulator